MNRNNVLVCVHCGALSSDNDEGPCLSCGVGQLVNGADSMASKAAIRDIQRAIEGRRRSNRGFLLGIVGGLSVGACVAVAGGAVDPFSLLFVALAWGLSGRAWLSSSAGEGLSVASSVWAPRRTMLVAGPLITVLWVAWLGYLDLAGKREEAITFRRASYVQDVERLTTTLATCGEAGGSMRAAIVSWTISRAGAAADVVVSAPDAVGPAPAACLAEAVSRWQASVPRGGHDVRVTCAFAWQVADDGTLRVYPGELIAGRQARFADQCQFGAP